MYFRLEFIKTIFTLLLFIIFLKKVLNSNSDRKKGNDFTVGLDSQHSNPIGTLFLSQSKIIKFIQNLFIHTF